jgi:hypothetical protein
MDNQTLDVLLNDRRERQYWLKPIGLPDRPMVQQPEIWTGSPVEIGFATPAQVGVGDVLIAFRTGVSKLIYVAESLEAIRESTPEEREHQEWRQRWPWCLNSRNLTPTYGGVWNEFNLKPFALADEYNLLHPDHQVSLGTLNFGSTVLRIPRPFAEFLIQRIRDLE